ncbi:hypothetical protein ACF3MZ_07275 [Paenibacillaceae bacterium WGS1546]|uniref:hypothetical protein n=1 Tax=Cohnella sp. WGS1546 TaxID=3366810 RepID=UPI00372D14BA
MRIGLKPIALLLIMTTLALGGTGCMFTSEKQMTKRMMSYLEEKYGGSFEKEYFEKGSTLFPEMYGGAKMRVHPAGQPDIPFFVFKGTSSEGFNDDYPLCYFSYHYTEKYKHEIEQLDDRDLIVRFALGFTERPQNAEILRTPVDEFVSEKNREGLIFVYVGVPVEGDRIPEDDTALWKNVYERLKTLTDRDFIVSIGYFKQENYEDALELARIAHTLNFNWKYIREGYIQDVYFDRDLLLSDPSYFEKKNQKMNKGVQRDVDTE